MTILESLNLSIQAKVVASIDGLFVEEEETNMFGVGAYVVTTPLWAKCEDETHTPESGDLESSGTPENSEFNCRGQNTLHWGVLYINGKILKCRCPKWPCMIHLDIYNPSYGQKKGQDSKFDSRPLKVKNRPLLDVCRRIAR